MDRDINTNMKEETVVDILLSTTDGVLDGVFRVGTKVSGEKNFWGRIKALDGLRTVSVHYGLYRKDSK